MFSKKFEKAEQTWTVERQMGFEHKSLPLGRMSHLGPEKHYYCMHKEGSSFAVA